MITTKLILRKDKKDSAEKAPVYLRITKNRNHAHIYTGIKVLETFWDKRKEKLKSHYPNSSSANALLRHIVYKAESISHEMELQGRYYSAKMIKEKINDENSDNLLSYANQWVKDRKAMGIITYSSYIKYKGVIKKLEMYSNGVLRIDQFTNSFVKKYEIHLRIHHNNNTNTISSNLSCLRALANTLVKENIIKVDDNPFKNYRFRFEESQRSFLNSEQIGLIASVNLPAGSKIKLSQDIFLFCTQTGLRIGDALHLKKENCNGTHIIYYSQKTREYDTLKLTHKAKQIIAPYQSDERPTNSYIFDLLDSSKQHDEELSLKDQKSATGLINKNLNIIGSRCGLNMQLSTHLARHSMATNALIKGLSMEEIKAILNHSNIQTTQIYAKVVNAMKDSAIDKLERQ